MINITHMGYMGYMANVCILHILPILAILAILSGNGGRIPLIYHAYPWAEALNPLMHKAFSALRLINLSEKCSDGGCGVQQPT